MCSCEQIPYQASRDVLNEKGHIAKLLNKRNLVNLVNLINFSENSESRCQPKPSSHSRTFLSIMSICNKGDSQIYPLLKWETNENSLIENQNQMNFRSIDLKDCNAVLSTCLKRVAQMVPGAWLPSGFRATSSC